MVDETTSGVTRNDNDVGLEEFKRSSGGGGIHVVVCLLNFLSHPGARGVNSACTYLPPVPEPTHIVSSWTGIWFFDDTLAKHDAREEYGGNDVYIV